MNDSTAVILGLSSFVLFVVVYVWTAIALSAVFRKAGEESWKAWVPVINLATVVKLGGFSPYLVLIVLVPIFGAIAFAVIWVVALHRLSLGFGAGGGMTVLGVLLLPVWASVLGFGDARWQGAPAATGRNDDEDTPSRRRQEFDGPYVPLVGGWTPSDDDVRDPFGMPSAPVADTPRPPAPVSEPVAVPFAAPAGSLADAVPAPVDWAPPSRQHEDPAPPTSVFAALDAMRDSAPEEVASATDRDARPTAAAGDARATSSFPAVDADVQPDRTTGADTGVARSDATAGDVASAPVRSTAAEALDATPAAASPFAAASSAPAPSAPAPAAAASSAPAGDAPVERDDASDAPWARVPRRSNATPVDADAPIASVPLTRPAPAPEPAPAAAVEAHDDFPEPSEAVSAVVGAPDAGAPRSARASVSALYTQPEVPGDDDDDDFDAMDRTVVARRRRIPWALIPPGGTPVDITSTIVILGRRPAADRAFPDAQLIAISDETRTVSKTHARLELRADTWYVTDLGSTNGVLFATLMGTEVEAPPGEEIEAGERFFLGDAEVRLARSEA